MGKATKRGCRFSRIVRANTGYVEKKNTDGQSLSRVGKVASGASRIGFWRYEREGENASQVDDIREHPIHRCAVPLPQWGRLRYESTAIPPYCHFERKREIFFVRGQAKDVRIAASGKHRASSESEGRCFMQTALRKKTETGNEKDPSAALGMTKRGNASFHSFSTCCESQPRLAALGSPFQGKGLAWTLPLSNREGCDTRTPLSPFLPHFLDLSILFSCRLRS